MSSNSPQFSEEQLQTIHKGLAAGAFNACWDLIEKSGRSEEENEDMRRLAEVSMHHWKRVKSHGPQELSVGYWQLGRVYAISGQADAGERYARKCITISEEGKLAPFYLGYAWEALARAQAVLGDKQASSSLNTARSFCDQIKDEDSQGMLAADLEQVAAMIQS